MLKRFYELKSFKYLTLALLQSSLFHSKCDSLLCEKNVIVDNSDNLKIKGHVIPDSSWFYFWDAIDHAIEKSRNNQKDKEAACMKLRKLNLFKTIWECSNCGKLFVDGEKEELIEYSADSGKYNGVLRTK